MTRALRLVVSPHLDDAVFSSPAWMREARAAGADVLVLTAFSSAGKQASPADDELYARRRKDDEAALAILGATPVHAGLADAPFRSQAYGSLEGIVFGPVEPDDPAPAEVHDFLAAAIARLRPEAIHTMLGVGTHVDHRIVFNAVRALERQHPSIACSYAEDRPYCLVPGAAAVRLGLLGFRSPGSVGPAGPAEYSAALMRAAYVQAHVSEAQRERVLARAQEQSRSATATRLLGEAKLRAIPWTRRDAALFLEAMQRYDSQFETFFGSAGQARTWLGLAPSPFPDQAGEERVWRLPLTAPAA